MQSYGAPLHVHLTVAGQYERALTPAPSFTSDIAYSLPALRAHILALALPDQCLLTWQGDFNTGSENAGDLNDGNQNAGDLNEGNQNTGTGNSGNANFGDWNSGNANNGDFNSGNANLGNSNQASNKHADNSKVKGGAPLPQIDEDRVEILDLLKSKALPPALQG